MIGIMTINKGEKMSLIKKYFIILFTTLALFFFRPDNYLLAKNLDDAAFYKELSKAFIITIEPYELRGDIYNHQKKLHYYEDEQPVKLKISISGNSKKELNFGFDDWYNYIKLFVKPTKYLFYYDETEKKIELEGYSSDKELIEEDSRDVSYKVIKSEDLKDERLGPDEKKFAVLEIWDKKEKPFKENYRYSFCVKLELKKDIDIQSLNDILGESASCKDIYIIKPRTPKEKMGWLRRKADNAEKSGDYSLALEYHYKILEIYEKNKIESKLPAFWENNLFRNISIICEKNKDYENARKYAIKVLNPIEERLSKEQESLKYLYTNRPPKKYKDEIKRYERIISLLEEEHMNKEKILEALYSGSPSERNLKDFNEVFERMEKDPAEKDKAIKSFKFTIETYERDMKKGHEEMPIYERKKEKIKSLEKMKENLLKKIKEYDELIKKQGK
jgi:hypothetical protein